MERKRYGARIIPAPLTRSATIENMLDAMTAYNGNRLQQACYLFEKALRNKTCVGLTISGALTPAGYHLSCLIPLMESGFIDWIVTTGANIYHELHFALGFEISQTGRTAWDDVKLRQEKMIRIYDIVFEEEALFQTDKFIQTLVRESSEFQKIMGTAEFHYLCGKHLSGLESEGRLETPSLLEIAYRFGIPIFTSSPGDSSIGMNIAALQFQEKTKLRIDSSIDVNETAAYVYWAKKNNMKSAVIMLGGGSPKNFALQTEPQIQQIFGLEEAGHDFFIQITDARPDTGGLSGATPNEAITWGKVNPDELPNTVVVYVDTSIALPIMTAYLMRNAYPRPHKRLFTKREEAFELLRKSLQ